MLTSLPGVAMGLRQADGEQAASSASAATPIRYFFIVSLPFHLVVYVLPEFGISTDRISRPPMT